MNSATDILVDGKTKRYMCSVCDKRFTWKSDLNMHSRLHSGHKPFHCAVCSKGFVRLTSLAEHNRIHTGEKPYKCHVCDKAFGQRKSLQRHGLIHAGEKKFRCLICDKAFAEYAHLAEHTRSHTGEKPFTCWICSKSFSQAGNLRNHVRIHTRTRMPYSCRHCTRSFSRFAHLREHLLMTHNEGGNSSDVKREADSNDIADHSYNDETRPYLCTVCNERFLYKYHLKRHQTIHTGIKPYKCLICDKAFRQATTLQFHIGTHTAEKRFKCSVCDRGFNYPGNLKRHMMVYHQPTTGEGCTEVNASDVSENYLQDLERLADGRCLDVDVSSPTESSQARRTTDVSEECSSREQTFTDTGEFAGHANCHSEAERTFTCSKCHEGFTQHMHLQLHRSSCLTGPSPDGKPSNSIICTYCGKLLKSQDTLSRHVRIHTGEMKYACKHCSDCFMRNDQLREHLLKSHNEGTWFTCHICHKKFARPAKLKEHLNGHERFR